MRVMDGNLTTLTVPITIKWDNEDWLAEAKTLALSERGFSQEVALAAMERRVKEELCEGFGSASDISVSAQVVSAKAEITVQRFQRTDRSLFEFAGEVASPEEVDEGGDEA